MSPVRIALHTTVDVFEMYNEFALRFMERTGFLPRYLRFTLRLTGRLESLLTPNGGPPLFDAEGINTITEFAMGSTREAYNAMTLSMRELIDSTVP